MNCDSLIVMSQTPLSKHGIAERSLTHGNLLLASGRVNTQTETLEFEFALDREVRRLIDLHRGQWKAVETMTGISHSWISKFARGKITNPGYATLKRLHMLLNDRPVMPPPLPTTMPPGLPPRRRQRKDAAAPRSAVETTA